jgi:hypothetical protein
VLTAAASPLVVELAIITVVVETAATVVGTVLVGIMVVAVGIVVVVVLLVGIVVVAALLLVGILVVVVALLLVGIVVVVVVVLLLVRIVVVVVVVLLLVGIVVVVTVAARFIPYDIEKGWPHGELSLLGQVLYTESEPLQHPPFLLSCPQKDRYHLASPLTFSFGQLSADPPLLFVSFP